MPAHSLIFKLFSQQHALILHSVFIHSNIFDQKYQKFMFFRLQYAHFWALILVSIKFSMRHVYYFHKFFQQACLFQPARLFCTLEYLIWKINFLHVWIHKAKGIGWLLIALLGSQSTLKTLNKMQNWLGIIAPCFI